jgi:hypothetical protein
LHGWVCPVLNVSDWNCIRKEAEEIHPVSMTAPQSSGIEAIRAGTPQGGTRARALRVLVPVLCGYKCLGGNFKILILKQSPVFLFLSPSKHGDSF